MRHTIDSVKDAESIYSYGEYVLILGKHPWIFLKDGTFIAHIKSITRAYNHIFLPDNTVLLSSLGQRKLFLVSLKAGEIIWEIRHKKRTTLSPDSMSLSTDGNTVYYVYDANNRLYLDRIIPTTKIYESFSMEHPRGKMACCYNSGTDGLNLLYTGAVPEPLWKDPNKPLARETLFRWDPATCSLFEKSCCEREVYSRAWPVAGNDEYFLCEDFSVIRRSDQSQFLLTESGKDIFARHRFWKVKSYDPDRKLLVIRFTSGKFTMIIDCKSRKIVAQYDTVTPGYSFGCLIGDEFWIGSPNGIVKLPFPHMDTCL